MTKKWANKDLPGALHYVTAVTDQRRQIFRKREACIEFLKQLQALRDSACRLAAFVLMPEHFHLIANPANGDIRQVVGTLKSRTAKAITPIFPAGYFDSGSGENSVWQQSFKALPLWSGWMVKQKIDYIHANPIRANIVKTTPEYEWSSFHAFYRNSDDPLLKVDADWWWPDDVRKLSEAKYNWDRELEEEWKRKKGLG